MYGNYPNLAKFILESRTSGKFASTGMYVLGNMIVASADEMRKNLARYLVIYLSRAVRDNFDTIPANKIQGPMQSNYDALMSYLLVSPQAKIEEPTEQAIGDMSRVLSKTITPILIDKSDTYTEDFYGDLFDKIVHWVEKGTMFSYVEKFDFIENGKDVTHLYGPLKAYLPNIGKDVVRRRMRHLTVNPVSEEGNSLIDNMSEHDLLPGKKDKDEDFKSTMIDVWNEIRDEVVSHIDALVNVMIKESSRVTKMSPWSGWDAEEEKQTPEAVDAAKDKWEALFVDLLEFIENSMVKASKPLSSSKLGPEIAKTITHKGLKDKVKQVLQAVMIEAAKKVIHSTTSDAKLKHILNWFSGKEETLIEDPEDLHRQMASRRAAAESFLEQMFDSGSQNFWVGDQKMAATVHNIVASIFVEEYCAIND